ncbi:MAG: HAMP domain-containing histidine kinase [Rickettsiales bacterium]|nr:HAMP domain-containing histidine kinase [Rickettsiales bacterium]
MFTYLRYFYFASIFIVVLAAYGVGYWVYTMSIEDIKYIVKQHHHAIANSYDSSVWKDFDKLTATPEEMDAFKEDSRHFIAYSSIIQFSIYDDEKQHVFSHKNREVFDRQHMLISDRVKDFQVEKGIESKLITDTDIAGANTDEHMHIVISMIHIPGKGFIEIASNTTKSVEEMRTIQWVITLSIAILFIGLIIILMIISHRAEQIIAKQHEVNLQLTAAAASAEAENREKSLFLANISHELRTPLNAIIGFSEIIRKEAMQQLNETHAEYMEDIHNSGVHLLSLINDILDYSKAEAGKLEVEMVETDITKLIVNSMRLVIPRAEAAQVTLIKGLPKDHIIGTIDAKKFKQVLLNLLSNAVKFTPPGGEVKVSAWQPADRDEICIRVEDTGIGIAAKDIATVMTPFGQVDSKLSRKYEGTGLGLPLSKKFVEIMGGSFELDSEVNVGTTITLTFPQASELVITQSA